MPLHLITPAAAKLFIMYPFIYSALNAIMCAPFGTLHPLYLQCTCPDSRVGRSCEVCAVVPTRGECLQSTVKCYHKWTGPRCDICHACPGNQTECDDCSGPCNTGQDYYPSPDTNKCRYCHPNTTCSGEGTCQPVDGTCKCTDGFAGPGVGQFGTDCDRECLNRCSHPNGICQAGGVCKCNAPYCGRSCEYDMSHGGDGEYCSSAGYPSIDTGSLDCSCKCWTQGFPAQPVAFGSRCEYKCPIGTGGIVCGAGGTPVQVGDACMCKCGESEPKPITCDTHCKNGAMSNLAGECMCLYAQQDPAEYCGSCKKNWWLADQGCTQYCDRSTCVNGVCRVNDDQTMVECSACGSNRDPVIRDVVADLGETFHSNASLQLRLDGLHLGLYDKRLLTITSLTPAAIEPVYDIHMPTVQLLQSDQSTVIVLPHGGVEYHSTDETVHVLETAIPIIVDEALYEVSLAAEFDASAGGFNVTGNLRGVCESTSSCVAYNEARNELYSCIDAGQGTISTCSGELQAAPANTTVLMTHVKLAADTVYRMRIVDTLLRGCATCASNYFPSPQIVTENACVNFCTREHTCNSLGNCSEHGHCVCDHENLIGNCDVCAANYYPAPEIVDEVDGVLTAVPCANSCISDAMENPDGNYCSGHGQCVGHGTCGFPCAPVLTAAPNGWTGEHCQNACNSSAATPCSGHGSCTDGGRCNCDGNYFGAQCDVTCGRPEQYYYVDDDGMGSVCANNPDGCEENFPCGVAGSTCTRLKCNGAPCITTSQYIHNGTMISYEICTTESDNNTLRECTGWSPQEYAELNMTAKRIREEHGVYCEVGARKELTGFCRRAICNCGEVEFTNRITSTGTGSTVEITQATQPLAGEGCQVVGCVPAEFPGTGSFSSYCGEQPPPLILDPVALFEQHGENPAKVQRAVDEILSYKTQHCSHGVCQALDEQPGTSSARAAPFGAKGVRGKCSCRATPSEDAVCQSTSDHDWARKCCNAEIGGESPYFGRSCMDHCSCSQSKWWRGSCAGGEPGEMALGCNCRAGYSDGPSGRSTPDNQLFCGSVCKHQCKGIINENGTHLGSNEVLQDACPDASPSMPAYAKGCYDGYLPCSGHGTCAGSDGTCNYKSTMSGSCGCWGSRVSTDTVNAHPLLPNTVVLYGGDACDVPCPALNSEVSDFFQAYKDELQVSNHMIRDRDRNLKIDFYNLYSKTMCSGHGYCGPRSPVSEEGGMLRCTCIGNYGGTACDKQCKLDERAWGDKRPMQSKINTTAEDDPLGAVLQSFYGLNKCGPNARCDEDGNVCVPATEGAHLARQVYSAGLSAVATMTEKPLGDPDVINFFEQWSMAFVGEFATCASGYYSSKRLEDSTSSLQPDHYIFDLPKLVRWQLTRSCDARYSENTPMKEGGPWCCTYPSSGDAWQDATAANFGANTHGGCPDGYCPNFATGRQCQDCISTAFTQLSTVSTNSCPRQQGRCAICAGGLDQHLVSPFESAREARDKGASYTVHGRPSCEHCISHGKEKSGEQLYALASDRSTVCNGHGRCMGKPNTYSGISESPGNVADAPQGDSLLCEDVTGAQYQLGQCLCDDGWTGPTCAMPTDTASCGTGGVLTSLGRVSPHHARGEAYQYCKCDTAPDGSTARTGHYCEGQSVADNIYGFASPELMPCQSIQLISSGFAITPTLVECNDPSGKSPCDVAGLCQTCADDNLDPAAVCIEYKAMHGGIVDAHIAQVKARARC